MAHEITQEIPEELDGARVDKVLASLFKISRAQAEALFERGVTLDGTQARRSDRVVAGQVIVSGEPAQALELMAEDVPFGVRFEDQWVIVVDKPAGIVVHPGARVASGTLVSGLIHRYPELVGVGQPGRWGLVHRLDKGTSGLILVGRDGGSYESLVEQLRKREISRVYTTLIEGQLGAPTGTVDAPIGRDPVRPTRRAVVHGGKSARTHFEVVEYYESADASLVQVKLETGRTHQIRVHMSTIGHPVVGDRSYGATRRDLSPGRVFLHASQLGFTHPSTGEAVEVTSEVSDDLQSVLNRITSKSE